MANEKDTTDEPKNTDTKTKSFLTAKRNILKLTYYSTLNVFILTCPFEERDKPKNAGFFWDTTLKRWITPSPLAAAKFVSFADELAKKQLALLSSEKAVDLQPLNPPGLSLKPYQETTVNFCLNRKNSYMALAPGLGKTVCAAVVAKARKLPAVYICPPFLLDTVQSVFDDWKVSTPFLLAPDSQLEHATKVIPDFIKRHGGRCQLFIDEAHRFKSMESKRTQYLYKDIVPLFDFRVHMSGTPMPNRPMELFPVLNSEAREVIQYKNYFEFGRYFCGGRQKRISRVKTVWDFSGASNLDELELNLKSYMIKLDKDVLDLPPLLIEYVVAGDSPYIANLETLVAGEYQKDDDTLLKTLPSSTHMMTYRKKIGLAKAPLAIELVKSILDETNESVILFAYHIEVMTQLKNGLRKYEPVVIDGSTKASDRQGFINQFNYDDTKRLVIANYVAGGVGLNIQKASRIVICEYDWVPAVNSQAIDRAHRYGQNKTVVAQYIVFENSLDKRVLMALANKQTVIDQI